MKAKITFLFFLFTLGINAQDYINFYDINLKNALLSHDPVIDTNGDNEIQFTEARDYTGLLDVSFSDISNASQVTYFINITELNISNNNLTYIYLNGLDRLESLNVNNNQLRELDISNNIQLTHLLAYNNILENINIISNIYLVYVDVNNNNLEELDCRFLANLRILKCENNNISTLDLSYTHMLGSLNARNNKLVNLNLKNVDDDDDIYPLDILDLEENDELTCIIVDNPATFSAENELLPPGASYSTSCEEQVYVPDSWFEYKMIDQGIDTGNGGVIDHKISVAEAESAPSTIDFSGGLITDIRGIEGFTNTNVWDLSGQSNLVNVDLSVAPWITSMDLSDCDLTDIDLDGMSNLHILNLNNNQLDQIDVQDCEGMYDLSLINNNLSAINLLQCPNLYTLDIENNNISDLDITANTALHNLYLRNNNLSLLNPYNNTYLENIDIRDNSIHSFILANHPNLKKLECANNFMSYLYLNSATSLEELYCGYNRLTNLDLTNSPDLDRLWCRNNQLEEIDLSAVTDLTSFVANNNLFNDGFDLSMFANLTEVILSNNTNIIGVNLKNGNNSSMVFTATGNPAMTTVCVDDETAIPASWSVDDTSVYSTCAIAIPDSNFEQALIDLGIDSYHNDASSPSPNGYINTFDVEGITYLPIFNKNISDLTGINYFTDLESLIANNNNLTGIDVSALSNLRTLNLKNNQLDAFNMTLPNPSDLRNLYLDNNQDFSSGSNINDVIHNQSLLEKLTLADNNATALELTNFPNLLEVDCSNNPSIDDLDVSSSPNLRSLNAAYCNLTNLNVSNIHGLDYINVEFNNITSFILGSQPHLDSIRCNNNNISTLDVGAAPMLGFFKCSNNQLVNLDISNNHNIGGFYCSDNPLLSLNIKNNNNYIMFIMHADNLGTACCIQVDDETNTPPVNTGTYTYDWIIDSGATITEDCTPSLTYVPDDNFEQALINLGYDTVLDDFVATSNIDSITFLNISGNNIQDLTGIEDFIALENLICNNNEITTIDLSFNTNLISLNCSNNQVSSINVENCLSLNYLEANTNALSEINLENNTALEILYLGQNWLTSLNLVVNNNLRKLAVDYNLLTELNIQNGNNTNISLYNSNNNPELLCINVDDAAWSATNWTNIDSVSSFSETCGLTYVPDDNFENYLETHNATGGMVPPGNPDSLGNGITNDDYVETAKIETLLGINLTAVNIADLTGINSFEALTALVVAENNLTTLDLSNLVNLQALDANGNFNLASVTVANNNALEYVNFENDNLTGSLYEIINNSPNLIGINAKNNQLSGDVELFDVPNLEEIYLGNNNIESIDISETPLLRVFSVSDNNLEYLDLSTLSKLSTVLVSNCNLTYLNVQTGTNMSMLTSFDARTNPDLTCIQVDDIAFSEANWPHKDTIASYSTDCNPALTYVPDNNFEQALIDLGYDDVLDDYVLTANINTIINFNLSYNDIADLTGIEDFIALENLEVSHNLLTSIDLSSNINLMNVNVSDNLLTDITIGSDLMNFICDNNNLTNLDLESYNVYSLSCSNNNLSNLDLFNNTIVYLSCNNNTLSNIILSNTNSLVYLRCDRNALTSLSIENNDIYYLSYSNNTISNLDLSPFVNLETLNCSNNNISSLDLSPFVNLETLDCSDNNLQELNVQNGNNGIITNDNFITTGNPDLTCILVDDATWSTANWTNIDSTSTFVISLAECGPDLTYVPDNNFEQALIDLGYDDVLDDYVLTSNINGLTSLNIPSKGITDLTGIEDFISLEYLNVGDNNLTELDVISNTLLTEIKANSNNIINTNFSTNTNLQIVDLNHNEITTIDLSNNTNLLSLRIGNNTLSNLVLTNNTLLNYLECADASLNSLNVSTLVNLDKLQCDINNLTSLDLQNNTILTYLNCRTNSLTSLDVSNNVLLTDLLCFENNLTTLDVSQNTVLENLYCEDNAITELDLSLNTIIDKIHCQNNSLTSFNIQNGNNTIISVYAFDTTGNPDLTCILVDDAAWSTANWTNIDSTSTFVNSLAECDALAVADEFINTIHVYPNPVNDVLTVSINNVNPSKIVLFDTLGRQIKEVTNSNKISFDGLNSGVYFIKIHDENNNIVIKKIMKK